MSIPAGPAEAPSIVRALAHGDELVAVWRNDYGGLTFRAGTRYIKWCPRNLETSLADEAARLRWAHPHSPVPRVLEHGGDAEAEWLVTAAIPGESAVAPRWIADPATAVRAVGEGLRALHDALPVEDCPFVWDVPGRLANAAARGIHPPSRFAHPPPVDRAVVCHADACCPNTLIGEDGRWLAHVDLGQLGRRRPLGRHRRRRHEHRVELRPRLGGRAHRRLRRHPRPRAPRLLPGPLERHLTPTPLRETSAAHLQGSREGAEVKSRAGRGHPDRVMPRR